jgi:hypothetical protein
MTSSSKTLLSTNSSCFDNAYYPVLELVRSLKLDYFGFSLVASFTQVNFFVALFPHQIHDALLSVRGSAIFHGSFSP